MTIKVPFQIELDFSKETKRTVVYATDDETSPISTLYVSKSAFEDRPEYPAQISITVDAQ
jgi:hypothetical protein